jgi:carboxylesterase
MDTIWDLYAALTRRLLWWGLGSVLVGILLLVPGGPFWTAFGIQAAAWGAIDALIALLGRRASLRRQKAYADPLAEDVLDKEARMLRRLLWINTGLDVLYVTGGLIVALLLGATSAAWQGHGWGIVVQGAFLLFFDSIHAQSVPPALPRDLARLYRGAEHAPLYWQGGKPAALLVHGFLGTPAEIRPLAESLRQAGWTVQGVLLPGFGPDIETLPERTYEDWLATVEQALEALRREHAPVLLIGYSMGGALSVVAARRHPPDALVLLAPFVHLISPLLGTVWAVFRPFLPRYVRPLKGSDLTDPHLRASIADVMPDLDLDDAEVQRVIRQTALPVSILFRLRESGLRALKNARAVNVPTLIVQGDRDDVSRPQFTRRLARRLAHVVGLVEVDAGHRLVYPSEPNWPQVEREVLSFARSLLDAVGSQREAQP